MGLQVDLVTNAPAAASGDENSFLGQVLESAVCRGLWDAVEGQISPGTHALWFMPRLSYSAQEKRWHEPINLSVRLMDMLPMTSSGPLSLRTSSFYPPVTAYEW